MKKTLSISINLCQCIFPGKRGYICTET